MTFFYQKLGVSFPMRQNFDVIKQKRHDLSNQEEIALCSLNQFERWRLVIPTYRISLCSVFHTLLCFSTFLFTICITYPYLHFTISLGNKMLDALKLMTKRVDDLVGAHFMTHKTLWKRFFELWEWLEHQIIINN